MRQSQVPAPLNGLLPGRVLTAVIVPVLMLVAVRSSLWFECEFLGSQAGIDLVGGGGDWGGAVMVASSRFSNVGRPVSSGTDLPVINCLVEIGPMSQWALPSGSRTLIEGCNTTLLPDANSSATLFQPGAGESMILINSQLADLALGSASAPHGSSRNGQQPASWMLVNNRFARPAEEAWNVLMVRLEGGSEAPVTHVLAANASERAPVSGLLFGGGG
jgi:hypothetical protein